MPRFVATKDPRWTGKILTCSNPRDARGAPMRFRIDGVSFGLGVTGRVVGSPRIRWYFHGRGGAPGFPPWCKFEKVDACCEETMRISIEEEDGDFGLEHFVTCSCGATWELDETREWHFYRFERPCKECQHWSCPCCGDSCDRIDCSCDGRCSYS